MALQITKCAPVAASLEGARLQMRTAFIHELLSQARLTPKIFLTVGDLGYSVVEPFVEQFPDQFLNVGVAEQNMTGIAAGLASEGYHVFTYSIGNFATLRCLEQIRNDVCYHQLPVTIVAVGAGMSYGNLGYSHHAIEDIGILRGFPGLQVLSPSDPGEARECVQWLVNHPGPSYLRLGKAGEPNLHEIRGISPSPLLVRAAESNVALVATGAILKEALRAADILEAQRQKIAVWSCPWLNPVCTADMKHLSQYQWIFAVEEHRASTGLSAILRENLPSGIRVVGFGADTGLSSLVGTQEYLRVRAGLDAATIALRISTRLKEVV
jgi:transketolase